jgi:hypothetical protein
MRAERLFALKLLPLFAVSGYLLYRHHSAIGFAWMTFGACLIGSGLVWPSMVSPIKKAVDWLGHTLRSFLVRALLETIYFLIVTPLAWFARRIGDELFHPQGPGTGTQKL